MATRGKRHARSRVLQALLASLVLGGGVEVVGLMWPGSAEAQVGTVRRSSRRTARRTSRRTSARYGAYGGYGAAYPVGTLTTLPGGCATVVTAGVTYHQCGGTYYRPYYEGDTVVYVVESP